MKNTFILKKRATMGGFTLMELLVATALMIVLVGAIATVFIQAAGLYRRADARLRIFQDAKMVFQQFERDVSALYQNNGIHYSFSGGTVTFSALGPNSGGWDLYKVRYKTKADPGNGNALVRLEEKNVIDSATPPANFSSLAAPLNEVSALTREVQLASGLNSILFVEGPKGAVGTPEWISLALYFNDPTVESGGPNEVVLSHRATTMIGKQ